MDEVVTASTTLSYTDVSFTLTEKSFYSIFVSAAFNTSQPLELAVSNYSQYANPHDVVFHSETCMNGSFCGYTETPITLYVWAKYASATSNHIIVRGVYYELDS